MNNTIILKCIIPLLLFNLNGIGQTATFSSNFEDRNTDPEYGKRPLLEIGTSGSFNVVPNPHPDNRNNSKYVLSASTSTGTGGRAEYTAGRYETNEKKYIYTWKRYHAPDMFKDISVTGWVGYNQWKTWPCEYFGTGQYEVYGDVICSGGGIFNDINYVDEETAKYTSRAYPDCNTDFISIPKGQWNEFVLEIYWTNTDKGYYRMWRNDKLLGYSENIKTLFDKFLEGTCDLNWSNGIYSYWDKTGGRSQDSLTAYIDDIAIYDIDNGYSIGDVCPDCEAAPTISKDSSVYRINVNRSFSESDGYNNYIVSWRGETSVNDISNIFGQSNDIDVYLPSVAKATGNNTLNGECFPDGVIQTAATWSGTETHQIILKDLNPAKAYTFKIHGGTTNQGKNLGTQIWTTNENRDTVFASNNLCDMAELTNLVPDRNGDLAINVSSIGSTAYINSIEIIESGLGENTSRNEGNIDVYPNPTDGHFLLDIKNMQDKDIKIEIFNISGKSIYKELIPVNSNDQLSTIDVSNHPAGIYLALIKSSDYSHVEKISIL